MADEVHGSVQGPNGERLQIQLGSKSIGLSAKDLLPILLLVAGLVGGYLIYTAVKGDLVLLYARQQTIIDLIVAEQAARIAQTARLHKLLETHDYNQGRAPEDRLPLVLDVPPGHSQPEKGH